MKTKNIPDDIKSKSLNEAKAEISSILERLENETVNLDETTEDYKRLLILSRHVESIFKKKLDEINIKIYAKENNGKLFGSITSMNISEEIAKNKISINKKNIEIKNQITTVGIHQIRIKLYKNMFKEVSIEILAKSN